MSRAVMEGFHPRRPFGGFRHRDRCPMGTPMPSGSGGGAVRVHSTMSDEDLPRPKAGRVIGRPVEMSAFNAKAMAWPRNADLAKYVMGWNGGPPCFGSRPFP